MSRVVVDLGIFMADESDESNIPASLPSRKSYSTKINLSKLDPMLQLQPMSSKCCITTDRQIYERVSEANELRKVLHLSDCEDFCVPENSYQQHSNLDSKISPYRNMKADSLISLLPDTRTRLSECREDSCEENLDTPRSQDQSLCSTGQGLSSRTAVYTGDSSSVLSRVSSIQTIESSSTQNAYKAPDTFIPKHLPRFYSPQDRYDEYSHDETDPILASFELSYSAPLSYDHDAPVRRVGSHTWAMVIMYGLWIFLGFLYIGLAYRAPKNPSESSFKAQVAHNTGESIGSQSSSLKKYWIYGYLLINCFVIFLVLVSAGRKRLQSCLQYRIQQQTDQSISSERWTPDCQDEETFELVCSQLDEDCVEEDPLEGDVPLQEKKFKNDWFVSFGTHWDTDKIFNEEGENFLVDHSKKKTGHTDLDRSNSGSFFIKFGGDLDTDKVSQLHEKQKVTKEKVKEVQYLRTPGEKHLKIGSNLHDHDQHGSEGVSTESGGFPTLDESISDCPTNAHCIAKSYSSPLGSIEKKFIDSTVQGLKGSTKNVIKSTVSDINIGRTQIRKADTHNKLYSLKNLKQTEKANDLFASPEGNDSVRAESKVRRSPVISKNTLTSNNRPVANQKGSSAIPQFDFSQMSLDELKQLLLSEPLIPNPLYYPHYYN